MAETEKTAPDPDVAEWVEEWRTYWADGTVIVAPDEAGARETATRYLGPCAIQYRLVTEWTDAIEQVPVTAPAESEPEAESDPNAPPPPDPDAEPPPPPPQKG